MSDDSGKLVLTIFDELINRIKSTRPVQTNGKSLVTGFVYSQLVLGRMIDPRDYINPWSPIGGATLQDTMASGALNATPSSPGIADGTAPTIHPKYQRALDAAFRTSQLVDSMIMVTKDDTYLSYPAERKVSFAYESIIHGMQPLPAPPIAPAVQQQIDEAQKVLYELEKDDNGKLVRGEDGCFILTGFNTRLYDTYLENAQAYADAKFEYSRAQQDALRDPVKAQSWPMDALYYQRRVDAAWDRLKTMGAERIERALDTIKSVGVSMQARMIAKARQVYDAWNLGLAGVPIPVPYSYIEPSGWCDPTSSMQGWQTLKITSKEYNSHTASSSASNFRKHWESQASSAGGGGGFGFRFFKMSGSASGGGSSSSSSSSYSFSSTSESGFQFHNDAENLEIELEYGLCTVNRPWLIGDLFYMRNWYLVNNSKYAVSDGSIDSQAEKKEPLLPMIPRQFLVIRNVKIKAEKWNRDGQTLTQLYRSFQTNQASRNKFVSAGGSFSIGPFSLGGHGSSSSSSSSSNQSGSSQYQQEFGWRFNERTGVLEIKGAQIIAWLSEIVPACAPLDDPGL